MTAPHRLGCLLIHGFTSSPTEMSGLAGVLRQHGYQVSLPVLPGHGSVSSDLARVSHDDWIGTAENALAELAARTERQVAIGLSMGAILALHLAANHSLAGVVALAPALKLRWWQELGLRVLAPFGYTQRKVNGPDVNDDFGREVLDSYNEYPAAAALELFRLQRRVRAEVERITMPLLVIHSRQDHTVPLGNVDFLLARVRSKHLEKFIVHDSYHVLTVDRDRERIFDRIIAFIAKLI